MTTLKYQMFGADAPWNEQHLPTAKDIINKMEAGNYTAYIDSGWLYIDIDSYGVERTSVNTHLDMVGRDVPFVSFEIGSNFSVSLYIEAPQDIIDLWSNRHNTPKVTNEDLGAAGFKLDHIFTSDDGYGTPRSADDQGDWDAKWVHPDHDKYMSREEAINLYHKRNTGETGGGDAELPTTIAELRADPRTEEAVQALAKTVCNYHWLIEHPEYTGWHKWLSTIKFNPYTHGINPKGKPDYNAYERAEDALKNIVPDSVVIYLSALAARNVGLVGFVAGVASLQASTMTIAEVASTYDVHRQVVRDVIDEGKLPARQSGKTWLIDRSAAEIYWGGK